MNKRLVENKKIREYQKKLSKIEKKLVSAIEAFGYTNEKDFTWQYWIDCKYTSYLVDIAFPSVYLAIEIDGRRHDNKYQKGKDEIREREIRQKGWEVVRFRNKQVDARPVFWARVIIELYKELMDEYGI